MEVLIGVIGVILTLLLLPIILLGCAKGCNDEKAVENEPQLQHFRKNHSIGNGSKRSSKRQSAASVKEVVKATNGAATPSTAAYEVVEDSPSDIAVLRASERGITANGQSRNSSGPLHSTISVTSKEGNIETVLNRGSTVRQPAQDRLPELPNPTRRSAVNDRSPSTKRALPKPPDEDHDEDTYDHLVRDVPSHTAKSKTSIKITTTPASPIANQDTHFIVDETKCNGAEIGHKVKNSNRANSPVDNSQIYASIGDDGDPDSSEPVADSLSAKPKVKNPYTQIVKSSDHQPASTSSYNTSDLPVPENSGEPVYAEAPPVPDRLYDEDDVEASVQQVAADADENPQDSGSGYCVVNDAVIPMNPAPHAGMPGNAGLLPTQNYGILTEREPIPRMLARQLGAADDEDYYEYMDQGEGNLPAVQPFHASGDVYDEIREQAPLGAERNGNISSDSNHLYDNDLYAEIDSPKLSRKVSDPEPNSSLRPSCRRDSGYERVDFDNQASASVKQAQDDSVAFAEFQNGNVEVNHLIPMIDDDEDDYAECGDTSDTQQEVQNIADNGAAAEVNNSVEIRPYQRYQRKEHLYQEIDEVRNPENDPSLKE